MKAILMCLADPTGNPRPNRNIHLLNENGFTVDVLSYPFVGKLPVQKHYSIPKPSQEFWQWATRAYRGFLCSIVTRFNFKHSRIAELLNDHRYKLLIHENILISNNYDIIVVEDLLLLPLAFRVRNQAKIIFDAREFYTRQNEENLLIHLIEYPFRDRLCRHYLPLCDQLVTVSPGLADGYLSEFGVKMEVIRSTPKYINISVGETDFNEIRMVHHGIANKNRGIENMIEIVKRLDKRFTLDLYLVGSSSYIENLKQNSDCNRIRFCKPVSFSEIIPMLNKYDIGFFYVEPTTFNLNYCLPNKLFEFIQARLMVVIGPSPDMAKIVNEYSCGIVSPEFTLESMIKTLKSVTRSDIDVAKKNSNQAASELCYEVEGKRFLNIIENLFN